MKRRIQYFGSVAAVKKQSSFLGTTAIILGAAVIGSMAMPVSALDYQKTINVGFNLQDTLTVSLSSPNLIIDDLMPGTASDSNIITVNVLSNNPYGYTLTSNVGNDTAFDTDELRHSTSTTATPFSTITAGTTVSDLSGFTNYQWGYSYSLDGGTTWINDSGNTGYSGLPLYSAGEATLNEKTTTSAAAGDNIEFKIAAKAASTQLSGEYQNIINFIATGAPAPPSVTDMQNTAAVTALLPNVGDTATVRDSRDGKEYTVAKLADNNIWMTQNLAIEPGTHMTEADTQITSAQYNHDGYYALPGEGYDLRTDGAAASETSTGNCNSANNAGYTNACTHMADSQDIQDIRDADTEGVLDYTNTYTISNIGAWYNYAAATAGSIATASTSSVDVYNICPQGWTLPSHAQNGALVTALNGDYSSFNPLYGGYYNNGPHSTPATRGNWWSTTAYNGTLRRGLRYDSGSLSTISDLRYRGYYVRCILQSS